MNDTVSSTDNGDNTPLLLLGLIVAAAALLRFAFLDARGIWWDEGASLRTAEQSLRYIWIDSAGLNGNPPLYDTLQHFWMQSFGDSEAALRSLSAVLGTLSVPLVYLIGRALGGVRVGMIAAALLATSAIHVRYSQEARGYALLIFAASLALAGLAHILTRRDMAAHPLGAGRLAWFAYIAGTSIALYAHTTAILLPALANLAVFVWWLGWCEDRPRFFVNWLLANMAVLVLWSWWLPVLIVQSTQTMSEFWVDPPSIYTAAAMLRVPYGQSFFSQNTPGIDVALIVDGIILALAIWGLWTLRRVPAGVLLTITFIVGVPALTYLVTMTTTPIYIPRVLLWPGVAFIVLVAAGAASLRSNAAMIGLTMALVAVQLVGVWNSYDFVQERWREVAAGLDDQAEPGDLVIVLESSAEVPLTYYLERDDLDLVGIDDPRPYYAYYEGPLVRLPEIPLEGLAETLAGRERVWLVARDRQAEYPDGGVLAAFSGLEQVHLVTHRNLELFFFQRAP